MRLLLKLFPLGAIASWTTAVCAAPGSPGSDSGSSWEVVLGVAICIVGVAAAIFYSAYSAALKERYNFSILNVAGITASLVAEILLIIGLSPDGDLSAAARVALVLIGAVLLLGLVTINAARTSAWHGILVTLFQCVAAFLIMLAVVLLMLALGRSSRRRR